MSTATRRTRRADGFDVRFRAIFARQPSASEPAAGSIAREALALGLPGRMRRRAARLISRG